MGGVSAATTAALADAMLATGVSTDRVGTSIKRMIVNLSKGASATKAQKEQFEELGMSAEWVAKAMQEDSVGTLDTIFKAINDLPQERQVAALSTLFGQWAIEGGAKIVNNLDVYRKALEMVSDPSLYTGSMEREFNIKSQTPEAIETMLKSTKTALKIEIGDAFLPAKKAVQSLHDRLSEQHPKEYAGADAACRELGNAGEPGRGEAGKRYGHGAAVHPKGT